MRDDDGQIVPAPITTDPRLRSTILDVVCGLNEDVEWHWTMTKGGPLVSGYSIVRRIPDLSEFCAAANSASAASRRKARQRIGAAHRRDR